MSKARIARVVLDRAGLPGARPLDYLVPENWSDDILGRRVRAPLGRQQALGWVVEITNTTAVPADQLKPLLRLVDEEPCLTVELLETARYVAAVTLAPLHEGLKLVSPPDQGRVRRGGRAYSRPQSKGGATGESAGPQGAVHGEADDASMQESGVSELCEEWESVAGGLVPASPFVPVRPLSLTQAQQQAVSQLLAALAAGEYQEFLLHGVTGSGKTEVYLQLMEAVVERGLGAIILVPEIALTPQTVARFRARFGAEKVALLHHRLAPAQRAAEWWRVRQGEARIVVGPRSAVFAPVDKLGVIVIDEEHETSYKQEESPRYHARDVARFRCRWHGALLVLGTATPSLETYYEARRGRIQLLQLPQRIAGGLPRVTLVDMRKEAATRLGSPFSERLQVRLTEEVESGNQVILFLNRRGTAAFLLCRRCGEVVYCTNCQVSLTYHARPATLRCHYCGAVRAVPKQCPACGEAGGLHLWGVGTERIEAAVQELLPHARVARLDADTTRRRGSFEEILGRFARREVDVLVGTQMVAKGLDFPHVTLVGVIGADISLGFPDLRSAERTFQLLTQVAGRAGRAAAGEVIIQTYNPDQYSILLASRQDYQAFYMKEIGLRRLLRYPPFTVLARLVFSGEQEGPVEELARVTAEELKSAGARAAEGAAISPLDEDRVEIIGPAPAPIPRLKRRYRWHLLLKAWSKERLLALLTAWDGQTRSRAAGRGKQVRISIDIDPVSMV
ncbi:MAG: primosomal protein N' [Limnochordales bacterium]|nr:primosomal protein N' [Limnochordales bacterium]